MFDKLMTFLGSKGKMPMEGAKDDYATSEYDALGRFIPMNLANTLNCYREGTYDNTFPNITRIAEAFAEAQFYAIDERGQRLKKQPNIVNRLYNPNEEMSGSDFFETLAVMMMVHSMVYLLVWRNDHGEIVPGGPFTKDNIAGFTFLENVSRSIVGSDITYFTDNGTFTKDDVIALSLNVNPYSLIDGYSPSKAIKKWATVDDYIAEYQAANFRNGAIPAGQFTITARTVKEYNDTVDYLQKHHRGARNANNIVYAHRPVSEIDGKPQAAGLEWTPFSQTNKELGLQQLFDQANKKIDMNFGVPEEIKGYLQNSNYSSAEVAHFVFSRYVVYPKMVKICSKLTHEFNRLCKGGTGFALSFDYELPALTDARKTQTETLQLLLNQGFTLQSAIEALQLPRSFNKLQFDVSKQAEELTDLAVSESNIQGTEDTPEQTKNASLRTKRKAIEVDVPTDEAYEQELNPILVNSLMGYMNAIIDKAIEVARNQYGQSDATEKFVEDLRVWLESSGVPEETIQAIVSILTSLELESALEAAKEFAERLGIDQVFVQIPKEETDTFLKEISELIYKFAYDTVQNAAKYLSQAAIGGWNAVQLEQEIKNMKETNYYRVKRWVASEQHKAELKGTLVAATITAEVADKKAVKVWRINLNSPDICADCVRMNGEWAPINNMFSNGQMVPHYHPHCWCYIEIVFIDKDRYDQWMDLDKYAPLKSIKVNCPHCNRYLLESSDAKLKGVICGNGKCKHRYDIEVKNGKASFTEVNKQGE